MRPRQSDPLVHTQASQKQPGLMVPSSAGLMSLF